MVFKKRLDYGFNGFQAPFIPRAPRSIRRRGPSNKATEDGQACAFELLASLAGKLLQESESSSASSNASEGNHQPAFSQGVVEQERQVEIKSIITEGTHQGTCAESTQVSCQKHLINPETDCVPGHIAVNNNCDCWEKVEADVKSEIFKWENKFGNYSNRLVAAPENLRESCDVNIKNGFRMEQEAGSSGFEGSTLDDKCNLKDQLELYVSPALIDLNSNVRSPFRRESLPSASFSKPGNGIKLGIRDDDENFLRCNKLCTKLKAFRPPKRIAHRRIRKLLSSKYWKVAPKLKECELSRSGNVEFADLEVKPLYCKRNSCYGFERFQHGSHFKRRKFIGQASAVTSDGGLSSESISNSPEKGLDGGKPSTSAKLHVPKDSHVKFSIKSLRIPELYIEVPETATVGSLKRTVMEAVMAILGGDVHVGVLLRGKKVRDDNRTLVQTGIACKENLDTLNFTLEPPSLLASPVVCVGDPSSQCETSQPTRSPGTPVIDSGITLHDSLLTNPGNLVESNHESTSSPTDPIVDKITPDSRALVAVPAWSTEALAVVPLSQKTKRSELVQRRTRRPFSVLEVEALVRAVEELGTGRWRDVKLQAFENADHRTYVDLKDKWKTLVHTARISPQQRRGEPVPQELLDRVLAAHAYWSQHQAKQHGKHQAGPETMKKITEASAERQSVEDIPSLVII